MCIALVLIDQYFVNTVKHVRANLIWEIQSQEELHTLLAALGVYITMGASLQEAKFHVNFGLTPLKK